MRILMAHNRYLERGGEDGSTEAEIALLRENGCEVDFFERNNKEIARLGVAKSGLRAIWSQESYLAIRALIQKNAYDTVHVQNFFPLISPSIYYAAQAERVPVVQTIRNYRLICPGANLVREGKACEQCVGKFIPWPGIVHGCYRSSRLSSAAVAATMTAHSLAGTWRNKVDRYIALTEFSRSKLVEGGLPGEKIAVKSNFVFPDPGPRSKERSHFIYVGRLSDEKGIDVLLDAWRLANVDLPLLIIGTGPNEQRLKAMCKDMPSIKFLGQKSISEVYELVGRAVALCFPSVCYENFGRTIIEAFAVATPVIAHQHGTMPEIIEEGKTGLLAEPGNACDVAEKLKMVVENPERMDRMGRNARQVFEHKYTGLANYRQLMSIYEEARHAARH